MSNIPHIKCIIHCILGGKKLTIDIKLMPLSYTHKERRDKSDYAGNMGHLSGEENKQGLDLTSICLMSSEADAVVRLQHCQAGLGVVYLKTWGG